MEPRLDLIGLIVSDMSSSLAFYRRLGFDIPDSMNDEGHVEALAGGIRIAWDTIEVVRSFSEYEPPRAGHRTVLAFLCVDAEAVDSKYEELIVAGYRSHTEPFDAFWGQRYASVVDPDGNPVDLFAPIESGTKP
jgi:uncharacterized glyoxalase superfamily protein PhnB